MVKPKKTKRDAPSTSGGASTSKAAMQRKPGGGGGVPNIWSDERFAGIINDSRFKGIPVVAKKVQVDKRFQSMFTDGQFTSKAKVDKYGRKLKVNPAEELKKYYELKEDDDEDDEDEDEGDEDEDVEDGEDKDDEDGEDEDDEDSDDEREREERAMTRSGSTDEEESSDEDDSELDNNKCQTVDIRGGADQPESASASSSDEKDDDEDEIFIEHVWGELDADAEHTQEASRRLAVLHMDWDRIRAVDVMVLLNSFLPRGSSILSIEIYPSEFGKERMKEEDERGPQELVNLPEQNDEEDVEEDPEAQKERLREYQLNRLKYYYAVVECDSVETADKLYKVCDGVEYESTANKIDLRFIPDDMEFDDEPKERCTEMPDMAKFVPRIFTTTALKQAKVELTWDENDLDRKEFNEKLKDGKWAEMSDADLKRYIVCSSSDEGEETDHGKATLHADDSDSDEGTGSDSDGEGKRSKSTIEKYKALLKDIKEQEQKKREEKVEMEFSWNVKDGEKANGTVQELQNDQKDSDDVNPFEKILQKQKEKKKRRKELKKRRKRGELDDGKELPVAGDASSDDDLPFGVDLNDPYFASAFDEKEFDVRGKQKKKERKPKKPLEEVEKEAAEEARRKAELELLLDDGEDDRAHFNLKAIQESEIDLKSVSKSKRKRILKKTKKQIEDKRHAMEDKDGFEIDTHDDRFSAIYSRPEFNIDPTHGSYKKTKGMEMLIQEKLKKRHAAEDTEGVAPAEPVKKPRKDVATTLLVKSIKRKVGKV